jgi:predicted DNA-binding transcriptional regulator YafY
MPGSGQKERITWLHDMISCGSYPNAPGLAERFGISLRQAGRDIEYMRGRLGAPLAYDAGRRGYRYTADFRLPDAYRPADSEDVAFAAAAASAPGEGVAQMMIPYDAVIEVFDRVTRLELGGFITGRAGGRNRYRCEFRNPDFFIGMLAATAKGVRVVSPDWLRERLVKVCEALIDVNSD